MTVAIAASGFGVPFAGATMDPVLALDAGNLALTDGAPVSAWSDASGFGRHATQAVAALQPVYKAGLVNGLPAVRFTGQGNYAPTEVDSLVVDFESSIAQPVTFFAVAHILGNVAAPNATDYLFDSATAGSRIIACLGVNGIGQDSRMGLYAGAAMEGDDRSAWDAGWRIFEFRFNGSASAIYINGTLYAVGDAGGNGILATEDLRIGAQYSNLYPFNGDLAELRIYHGVPTFAERNAVGLALADKYGIASAYVPPVNQPPTVSLSVTNNSVQQLGPLTVTALAEDVDGSVTNVSFFINGHLAALDDSAPYSFTWRTTATGTYEVVATAWDNDGASRSATVTVQRVSSLLAGATADALIYAVNNLNYGGNVVLEIGTRWGGLERAVMKFDLSGLPDVTPQVIRIDAIRLQLRTSYVVGSTAAAQERVLEVYPLTNSWTEGEGSAWSLENVTWVNRTAGVSPWVTPGGDFSPVALGTYDWSGMPDSPIAVNGSDISFSIDILPGASRQDARDALIQGWRNGANDGLIVKNNSESANMMIALRSRENGAGQGPVLQVDYTVLPKLGGTLLLIN